MSRMSRYAKAVAAFFGAISTWGLTAAVDGSIDLVECFGLLGALAAVLAVFGVPNTPPDGEARDHNISERYR